MVKNNKKIKQQKFMSEDMIQVRNLIILLLIVVLVCVGIYFLTNKMIEKEEAKKETTQEEVSINYDIATIGTMFNRPESEYYVILYSEENNGEDYSPILAQYRSSDNYIKTYFIDLDKYINKSVLKDTLNKKPNNSEEISVTGPTLYKIENGKVTKCYSTLEDITEILK